MTCLIFGFNSVQFDCISKLSKTLRQTACKLSSNILKNRVLATSKRFACRCPLVTNQFRGSRFILTSNVLTTSEWFTYRGPLVAFIIREYQSSTSTSVLAISKWFTCRNSLVAKQVKKLQSCPKIKVLATSEWFAYHNLFVAQTQFDRMLIFLFSFDLYNFFCLLVPNVSFKPQNGV